MGTSDAISRLLSMSEEEKKEIVSQYVEQNGLSGTIELIKKFISEVRTTKKQAATEPMYQGQSQDQLTRQEDNPHNDQLKHKLKAGDWIDLLVFMIMLGTAGSLDQGTMDILDAFLITSGAGFVAWTVRLLRNWASK